MLRCALTYLVIIGIAAFGYQPASTAMLAMSANMDLQITASSSASDDAAMSDCAGMHKQSKEQKLPCEFDGSCAARCHLNTGLEAVSFVPLPTVYLAEKLAFEFPAAQTQVRPGPHVRPPIV